MSYHMSVPRHLMDGPQENHYVLRIVGDSMIGEGICDGDFIVVMKCDTVECGELVIARIGDDATIKRYFPEDSGIVRLEPANKDYKSILTTADEVKIDGVVIGLMRKFERPCKAEKVNAQDQI